MNRREMMIRTGAAAVGLGLAGLPMVARAAAKTKKALFFSKSSGFEHSVIHRENGQPGFAEKILADLGPRHGIEFTFSKDGSLFNTDYLSGFDAFVFYTTGDLTTAGTDKNPPMTADGKAALLEAIKMGKGFVGVHSATDTFHTPEPSPNGPYRNDGDQADPYIRMIGAEFIIHGKQQHSKMLVADAKFAGLPKKDFDLMEEWYSFKNFEKDLHVILVQETAGMEGHPYERPPYPATWARKHGKGRVFYTSLGHREDTWTNPLFQQVLFGGIAWANGSVKADARSNIQQVTPGFEHLPPK